MALERISRSCFQESTLMNVLEGWAVEDYSATSSTYFLKRYFRVICKRGIRGAMFLRCAFMSKHTPETLEL